ncbi:Rieske (2Fe-2S) protein [Halostella salina]|uniref:Rieske (2Fe-2S) protein n=1 Tax=Halostella salina TaxID=1547897 RepID=UPI000EF811A5|nr:Rieske (2Fe-2S) protein [Halostella salina]
MTEKRFEICPTSELPPGDRVITTLDGISIGVFNIDGEYHALKNDCPHQRAPLCEGKLTGTTESTAPGQYEWTADGQIVQCPWHGWEFDVTTGESVFNPHSVKAKTFQTTVESTGEARGGSSAEAAGGSPPCSSCETSEVDGEPPVDTYDVEVEHDTVVVYL